MPTAAPPNLEPTTGAKPPPARRFEAEAAGELRWFFGEAEADACGLKAVTWNVLEEADPSKGSGSGPGVKRGAPPVVDPHPDDREWARVRLRRVWLAFSRVPHAHRSTLEAQFTPRGANAVRVLGLDEHSQVAALLPEVQRAALASRRPRLEEVRFLVARLGLPAVLALCHELERPALAAYVWSRFPQLRIQRHTSQ